jgi:cysteine desulfurase
VIYLDNQATTPTDPRIRAASRPYFEEEFGNPHSAEHAAGQRASAAVEAARAHLAALIGAEPREIVFTSGATEANNLAIKGAARFAGTAGPRRIVTVATEHKCVLESVRDLAAEGFEPVILPVRPDGVLDPQDLRTALQTPTLLVSVMAANNETGVLQDIGALASMAREAGALFHTDLAQAAGKIAVDVTAQGIHLASISGHKIYGPKGVGALYVRRRPRVRLAPLFSGGGQERGLRSGTLPTPLVVGLGEACRLARAQMDDDAAHCLGLRARLLERLRARLPGLVETTAAPRLPGAVSLRFPSVSALALIESLPGLCVSTGSACSSAEIAPSYVLTAMGLAAEQASRTLRLGIGRFTSTADIDQAADMLAAAAARLAHPSDPSPQNAILAEACLSCP